MSQGRCLLVCQGFFQAGTSLKMSALFVWLQKRFWEVYLIHLPVKTYYFSTRNIYPSEVRPPNAELAMLMKPVFITMSYARAERRVTGPPVIEIATGLWMMPYFFAAGIHIMPAMVFLHQIYWCHGRQCATAFPCRLHNTSLGPGMELGVTCGMKQHLCDMSMSKKGS